MFEDDDYYYERAYPELQKKYNEIKVQFDIYKKYMSPKQRREAEDEIKRLRDLSIEAAARKSIKNKIWESKDGPIRLGDMESSHLKNCLNLYTRTFDEWWEMSKAQSKEFHMPSYNAEYERKMPDILKAMKSELEYRDES